MSKVRDRSHKITNKPLRVRTTNQLEKQTIMLSWRIVVNRISKVRQTTCNWIKKILDEATRIVNVFLISWFFYLFLLCSITLLVKYDFILQYEAWVNAIRASSFIENVPQISAKPLNRFPAKIVREALTKLAVLYQSFFSENSREIGSSFREFVSENPVEFDFFSATYQKPGN